MPKRAESDVTRVVYPRGTLRSWDGNGNALLIPFSGIYGKLAALKRTISGTPEKCIPDDVSVISIGNIEAGGTGKTPFAISLISGLMEMGSKPVYISRGYKSRAETLDAITIVPPSPMADFTVPNGNVRFIDRNVPGLFREIGDEGAMVAMRHPAVPLLFSKKKAVSLDAAVSLFSPTHAIVDDGFQTWSLYRDVDIVLVDSSNPFGNGRMLPAGSLREEVGALRRADVIGVNGCREDMDLESLKEQIEGVTRGRSKLFFIYPSVIFMSREGREMEAPGVRVATLSSIARPQGFEALLSRWGLNIALSVRLPDHHHYNQEDIGAIERLLEDEAITSVVTTEKDWVKLNRDHFKGIDLLCARLCQCFKGVDVFEEIKKPQAKPAVSR